MIESDIDHELVCQCLKGEKQAFDVLVLKYQHTIERLIIGIIKDKSLAADITQDVFINAYRSLHTFKGNSSFYTWLYRIAINRSRNFIKMKTRKPLECNIDFAESTLIENFPIKDYTTPESILSENELHDALLNAVNRLPEDLRTSIILREMAGLTYVEIANIMECPIGTVRSRLSRAREAVDHSLKPLMGSH